ncbi:N-6 DNA methylase [Lentibacillus amyloliquefaciens]|uniref:site-specific DNA-methyltransferase (adenine-specific) n=1 Tax=Lentibacillus amyloliquefaciens TaxID=1472767 RepID=A0A0U4G745_9BACI|nr:N-6 DNA methylase [Lentibacillus amyloliquefaciens]ALX48522.1 SAM-dependent methyltransferase [Lentibacillus amyloliquefaciens]
MGNQEIVQKLWNLCNVLRDDGITYHQYVTELTYILFLKMMKEKDNEADIPEQYRWDSLTNKHGVELHKHYRQLLLDLGEVDSEIVKQIYTNATTNIDEPKNLEKIIRSIDDLDWYSAREEGLGDLYEGLLEKNASETKSGAGQYFTPRPLIDVIVRLIDPQPGERLNDPAAGTFGFMIAGDTHIKSKTDDHFDLSQKEAEFQRYEAFTGAELVKDTHRLALMNALLHNMRGEIKLGDTLSEMGSTMKNFDVVMTNPPFGTKKGGERPTRDDLTFETTNKQLNFLQHIYRSLKANGEARAAVVLPDNVLFESGTGAQIRADLMDKCNLHTILRLPTGIFYAQGVKTNVLFFNRGKKDKDNTNDVWVYDMRTNMPSFGKRTPLTEKHFDDFVKAYQAEDRSKVDDERWNHFTRDDIRKKDDSLDIGLIADESLTMYENLPDPIESAEDAVEKLQKATSLLNDVIDELKAVEAGKDE